MKEISASIFLYCTQFTIKSNVAGDNKAIKMLPQNTHQKLQQQSTVLHEATSLQSLHIYG